MTDGRKEQGMEKAYCDQGHPAHDPKYGCGPCKDEEAAGYGMREYAWANPLSAR